MEVNLTLVFIATVAQFILGAVWYSPLMFGKWWMQIMEKDKAPIEEIQKMQKEMAPFYGLQFVLAFVTTFMLAHYILYWADEASAYYVALMLLIGFIVPTQISGVVWANTKRKFWAKQIFVMVSYQFVGIMLAAWILSM
jgi:hypothetical protein